MNDERPTLWGIVLAGGDPRAVVVILPSDHCVLSGRRFMHAVAEAADFSTGTNTDAQVLPAVDPTDSEPDYGWIEPGSAAMPDGRWAVQRIKRFIEKLSGEHARMLRTRGWLWNTMALVARANSHFRLTQEVAPEMAAYFSMIQNAIGTHWEQAAVNDVYRMMPSVDFSSAILAKRPEQLVTLPVRSVWWSDWGRRSTFMRRSRAPAHHFLPRSTPVRMLRPRHAQRLRCEGGHHGWVRETRVGR